MTKQHEFLQYETKVIGIENSGDINFTALGTTGWKVGEGAVADALSVFDADTGKLHFVLSKQGQTIDAFENAVAHVIYNNRAARGTVAAPAYLNNGDTIAEFRATPARNLSPLQYTAGAGALKFVAGEAHSQDNVGTTAELWVTRNTTNTPVKAFYVFRSESTIPLGTIKQASILTDNDVNLQIGVFDAPKGAIVIDNDGIRISTVSSQRLYSDSTNEINLSFPVDNGTRVFHKWYSINGFTQVITSWGSQDTGNLLKFNAHGSPTVTVASYTWIGNNKKLGGLEYNAWITSETFTNTAAMHAKSTEAHEAGKLGTRIEFQTTANATDTAAFTAAIEQYVLLPGVLDLAMATVDTRIVTFRNFSSNATFGYVRDLINTLLGASLPDGVSLFDVSTTIVNTHIGVDGYIYQSKDGVTVYQDETWRVGPDSNTAYSWQQYDDDADTWNERGILTSAGFILPATAAVYLGDAGVNGTWRIVRSGDNLVFERREGGNYVEKLKVEA